MSIPLDTTLRDLDDCGCCTGIRERTPEPVSNRPGLPAITHRVGTYSTFLASLLAGLSTADRPRLRGLSTREPEDFTIAFLDAVATTADVLTFYQERIANESYLRTATERRSLLELARAIGYELGPGVAAETVLAFTIEGAPGAPLVAEVGEQTRVQSVPGPGERPQTFETIEAIEARAEWNELVARRTEPIAPFPSQTEAHLAGVATGLEPGDAFVIVGDERVRSESNQEWDFRFAEKVEPDHERGVTRVTWKPGLGTDEDDPRVDPASESPRFYALRSKATLFGSTAPDWRTLPDAIRDRYLPEGRSSDTDTSTEWPGLTISAIAGEAGVAHLDGLHREILAGSWLVIGRRGYAELFDVVEVDESARRGFGIAAKTTRVELRGEHLHFFDENVRDAIVYAESEEIELAESPVASAVAGDAIDLDRVVSPLPPGRLLVVTGRPAGSEGDAPLVTELATAESTEEVGDVTRLHLAEDLSRSYERGSVRVAANVARATHGESTAEPIGSGDASQPFQRFELRESPMTHVYADAPPGRRSTLELRIDALRWAEVPTLFGRGPRERVYTIRRDDEGRTAVQLGDGRTGARPPTGSENVQASYRKGLGREGNLDPGKLTLLLARPLGVRSVRNLLPATGGSDPEALADARTNAPLTVLTLDRIVSLDDYADFARAFEGVAKAHATWVWGQGGREILLTVAGSDGAAVPEDGPAHRSLRETIAGSGDPNVPVTVRTHAPVPFRIAATIERDEALLAEQVLADVEAALGAHFSFTARSFGQPVPLSEVLAVLHGVRGVVSVDVNGLYTETMRELRQRLDALVPVPGGDAASAQPAQLLTIELRPGDVEVIG
jgi:predicted phage baseplate assembly protein